MKTKAIYEAKGRAREFSELACNLYDSCPHSCLYCYVPAVLHREKADFHKVGKPRFSCVQIGDEAWRLHEAGEKRAVLFCFACDPYPQAMDTTPTRQAIQALQAHGLKVNILTKGGIRALRDFDLLGPGDSFGTTLTCLHKAESLHWEPGAALPEERINVLEEAHKRGIRTWVSCEPVIYLEQTLELIRMTHAFVDSFKIGKLNYHAWEKAINWTLFAQRVVSLLDSLGASYYIKKDLAKYLGHPGGILAKNKESDENSNLPFN